MKKILFALLAVMLLVNVMAVPALAQEMPEYGQGKGNGNPNPGVLPPDSNPHGMSYSEWGDRWWQWALAQPADVNPVTDPTGENCGEGQSGKVWFLAGTFGDPTPYTRACTIPSGRMVFFPVINVTWIQTNFDPPFDEENVRQQLRDFLDPLLEVTELSVTIDGVPVEGLMPDPSIYRVQSLMTYDLVFPQDNVFGIDESVCPADGDSFICSPNVGDGIYLMLAPLSTGEHTIHISAEGQVDVTYNLTVGPGGKASGDNNSSVVPLAEDELISSQSVNLDDTLFLPALAR